MAVFWKEDSGRQPQLITRENEEGYETNYPSPPTNFHLIDDPDVPLGWWPRGPPAPPGPPGPRGLPPGWPPAPSPAGNREKVRAGNGRFHLRSPPPELQLIPIPMSDGDDKPPQQHERQRRRSISRERVHSHAQVLQVPQIQPVVTPEPGDVSDGVFTATERDEGSTSRERVPPHSSSHASQLPPSSVQQTQTLATQGADEESAAVDPQNRVSSRTRSPKEQEGSRRQGPPKRERKLLQKNIRVNCRRPQSTSTWIRMRTMQNLKMSVEPLQPLTLLTQYFLTIKDQQKILKDQLALTTLQMKMVNRVMNTVHKVRILKGLCTAQFSTF